MHAWKKDARREQGMDKAKNFLDIPSQRSPLFRENEVNEIPVPLEINKERIYITDKYLQDLYLMT
jgi:hypothetical protein